MSPIRVLHAKTGGSMTRERRRRRGARPGASAARAQTGWRATLASFGGFTVVGLVVFLVIALGAVVWFSRPTSVSEAPLLGETITLGPATHVATVGELQITPGQPPVGGPHFPRWMAGGVYGEPVSDGLAVHSLEHGMIWITYNPNRVQPADIDVLKKVTDDHSRDVILSPRPDNAMPIALASWGRLLTLERADRGQITKFIETNRDRSPEPGVR